MSSVAYGPEEGQRTASPEALQNSPQIDESDIYRGSPPSPNVVCSPSLDTLSSSSSSLFSGRGRLGAIAAVVELAISRWAGGDPSGLSTSSLASEPSVALPRSRHVRLRRRSSSIGTFHIPQSKHDITAHINRIKALEESRQTPRQFTLYIPPSLPSEPFRTKSTTGRGEPIERFTSTTSLTLVLSQLDIALKRATKARHSHLHSSMPDYLLRDGHKSYRGYAPPGAVTSQFVTGQSGTNSSPKGKNMYASAVLPEISAPFMDKTSAKKAWFLDVASPTWEDMRTIGKLLHLHPLTLEDILQQDPREKLELFPKLGYYFISFRAIQGQFMSKQNNENDSASNSTIHGVGDSVLGEANVYLVVFNEGICTFHFTDISEHTDRIKNRIVLFEEALNMSSDWIAHGILDSIVDSFFPFLTEIEKEVAAIDNLIFAGAPGYLAPVEKGRNMKTPIMKEKNLSYETVGRYGIQSLEKIDNDTTDPVAGTLFSLPKLMSGFDLQWLRFNCARVSSRSALSSSQMSPTHLTIQRMARTRKLVTSLARLLASKSEVISQIRKRLLTSSHAGLGNGTSKNDEIEVAIYMGDVQDHILFLQHSLAHYERMLSQSHPNYLSQLRTVVALTKNGTDKAIISLTVVTVAVLCIQTLIGTFSLNITVPTNDHSLDGSYHVFGIVIALAMLILCSYLFVVWRWWIQAKRRRRTVL